MSTRKRRRSNGAFKPNKKAKKDGVVKVQEVRKFRRARIPRGPIARASPIVRKVRSTFMLDSTTGDLAGSDMDLLPYYVGGSSQWSGGYTQPNVGLTAAGPRGWSTYADQYNKYVVRGCAIKILFQPMFGQNVTTKSMCSVVLSYRWGSGSEIANVTDNSADGFNTIMSDPAWKHIETPIPYYDVDGVGNVTTGYGQSGWALQGKQYKRKTYRNPKWILEKSDHEKLMEVKMPTSLTAQPSVDVEQRWRFRVKIHSHDFSAADTLYYNVKFILDQYVEFSDSKDVGSGH